MISFDESTIGNCTVSIVKEHYFEDIRSLELGFGPVWSPMMTVRFSHSAYQRFIWGSARPLEVKPFPQKIESSRYVFDAVHAPGRSRGMNVFHVMERGWLLSGDRFLASRIKQFRADEILGQAITAG